MAGTTKQAAEMVKLFAEYLNKRLDQYLEVLGDN